MISGKLFYFFVVLVAVGQCQERRSVTISLMATELPSMDSLPPSQSDPVLEMIESEHGLDIKHGFTEVIKDNNSPIWTKTYEVSYPLGSTKELLFIIYDDDGILPKELIGQAILKVGELNSNPGSYQLGRDVKKPDDDFTTFGVLHLDCLVTAV